MNRAFVIKNHAAADFKNRASVEGTAHSGCKATNWRIQRIAHFSWKKYEAADFINRALAGEVHRALELEKNKQRIRKIAH